MSQRGRQYDSDDSASSRSPSRSSSPSTGGRGGAPQRQRGRSISPLEMFGEELSEEERLQYQELLDHFGGDEESLKAAIEDFMEEYNRDPEKFEALMQAEDEQQQQERDNRSVSRSPSTGARR